ncbi:MAG TPA: hypothetical protein VMW89_05810 [Desulfatiglandales bacterium]|nr:hypothetical protein [Desulfatiglandales bacterium]
MDISTKISIGALVVATLTGILGAFGGIPGIKSLFFSKPRLKIEGFMPAVVYDEGNTKESMYPKFTLKGMIKVSNPNNFDININEIKLYGRTQDSSGKYKHKGNPLFYELSVPGLFESGSDIVKAYSSAFLRCNFTHFENDQEPGVMHAPMKGGYSEEVGSLLFHIYVPSYNQLFKFNERRVPYELVGEAYNGKLNFAVVFNNELIKLNPKLITTLVAFSKDEWENNETVIKIFNATTSLSK